MPFWLSILLAVLVPIFVIIVAHFLWLVFCGYCIRDNIVFKNKYKRKIYQLKEKLKNYESKINERISYLEYKSIYTENIKILHEKSLDKTCIMNCDYFTKNSRKKVK